MKKKIQKKEVAKNYFSDISAFIISFILPVLIGLIGVLFEANKYADIVIYCALLSVIGPIPLEGLISFILKFKKDKKPYVQRYIGLKGTLAIICIPLIIYFLLIFLINKNPIYSWDTFIQQYYYNGRSILFIIGNVCLLLLNFLCLTKRIKRRWAFLWIILMIVVALNGQQVDYVPRSE